MLTKALLDLHTLRQLGELCRFTWWGLLRIAPGDDVSEFTQQVVHPLITHWDLCEPLFARCIKAFAEAPYGETSSTHKEIWCTAEIKQLLEKHNGSVVETICLLRWATVFFWGFPETTQALIDSNDFRKSCESFVIKSGNEQLFDIACLEGCCMAIGHPTQHMQQILSIYGKGNEEDPVLH